LNVWGGRLEKLGGILLRYGVAFLLFGFGLLKFTPQEVAAISPLLTHSPLLGWMATLLGMKGAAAVIGVIELITAAAMALRRYAPRISAAGSLLGCGTFVVTLSFLVTTPNIDPGMQFALMKDFFLLAACVWSAGEALRAAAA
jgi:reactive chlorine resistance protein C